MATETEVNLSEGIKDFIDQDMRNEYDLLQKEVDEKFEKVQEKGRTVLIVALLSTVLIGTLYALFLINVVSLDFNNDSEAGTGIVVGVLILCLVFVMFAFIDAKVQKSFAESIGLPDANEQKRNLAEELETQIVEFIEKSLREQYGAKIVNKNAFNFLNYTHISRVFMKDVLRIEFSDGSKSLVSQMFFNDDNEFEIYADTEVKKVNKIASTPVKYSKNKKNIEDFDVIAELKSVD